ncbi:MAG: aldo/keto reductase [Leucobacter sp.]
MKYNEFPASGRAISAVGFGAMGFAGWFGSNDEALWRRSLISALEQGVNIVDTARAYGESERIVGEALREWSGEQPFVATKVESLGPHRLRWGVPRPVEEVFPHGQVTLSAETSLRELGIDRLDLLQLHLWWGTWGTEGYWLDELRALQDRGLVSHIGVSIPDHRSDMALPLVQSGAIDSVQTIVNVFDPLALDVLVPACQQHGVAVLARCVLDEGGLTGAVTRDRVFDADDYRAVYFDATVPREAYLEKVDALRQYVPEHASSLAALALKFVAERPGVTSALTSMHTLKHGAANIAALDEPPLNEDLVRTLATRHRFVKNFNHATHW